MVVETKDITNEISLPTLTEEIISAPKLLRFINLVIDLVAITIIFTLFSIIVMLLGQDYILDFIIEMPSILFGLICYLIYYLPFEAITGRTVGKYVTGTKVVALNGEEFSIYHAAGRSFLRAIPFDQFSIFRSCNLCWHDSLMNTSVIKCR